MSKSKCIDCNLYQDIHFRQKGWCLMHKQIVNNGCKKNCNTNEVSKLFEHENSLVINDSKQLKLEL